MTSLSVMAAGDVPNCIAQPVIFECLCNEGEEATDIHRRPQLRFEKSACHVP
jgi:hypothetical protein